MDDIKKMISEVQLYIHHVKGVEVNIRLPENKVQMILLVKCSLTARQWLATNIVRSGG